MSWLQGVKLPNTFITETDFTLQLQVFPLVADQIISSFAVFLIAVLPDSGCIRVYLLEFASEWPAFFHTDSPCIYHLLRRGCSLHPVKRQSKLRHKFLQKSVTLHQKTLQNQKIYISVVHKLFDPFPVLNFLTSIRSPNH